jgi:hypothetical protein
MKLKKFDDVWEKQMKQLSEKEQNFFARLKKYWFKLFTFLKDIAIFLLTLNIFFLIYNRIGFEKFIILAFAFIILELQKLNKAFK